MSYVLAFAGFALLIILHEAGHFAAAKAVGMRVERFALFFPPLLFKVRRGETEYGIGAIPLGGYVRISGMNPYEEIPEEHSHRAYFRQPVWKRIVVIAAGPFVNVVIGVVIFAGIFAFHGTFETTNAVAKGALKAPALGALQAGDRILAVDGRRGGFQAVQKEIQQPPLRDGAAARGLRRDHARAPADRARRQRAHAAAAPALQREREEDADRLRVRRPHRQAVGRRRAVARRDALVADRPRHGQGDRADLLLVEGAQGRLRASSAPMRSPSRASASTPTQALLVLGIISLSLAVVNLFPFLPLDGGHIFWALAEKVRGKPIPFSVIERASAVGFVLVIMLFVIGLSNDIGRLRGEGFGVR